MSNLGDLLVLVLICRFYVNAFMNVSDVLSTIKASIINYIFL